VPSLCVYIHSFPTRRSSDLGSYGCCHEEGILMLPLEGITIISLEQAVAAPFATRQLADLGARVVKIERPSVGDFARDYDETVRRSEEHTSELQSRVDLVCRL